MHSCKQNQTKTTSSSLLPLFLLHSAWIDHDERMEHNLLWRRRTITWKLLE
jgi:hypothetical protein